MSERIPMKIVAQDPTLPRKQKEVRGFAIIGDATGKIVEVMKHNPKTGAHDTIFIDPNYKKIKEATIAAEKAAGKI